MKLKDTRRATMRLFSNLALRAISLSMNVVYSGNVMHHCGVSD